MCGQVQVRPGHELDGCLGVPRINPSWRGCVDVDEKRFFKACELRDEGKLREAFDEFLGVAAGIDDPIDKAGVLLNAVTTLNVAGEYEEARRHLSAARLLVPSLAESLVEGQYDDRLFKLQASLDFEDAEIFSFEGRLEIALAKFDSILEKYGQRLQQLQFRETYEMVQSRRGFLRVDLGRWREALPVLEEAESFEGRKSEIYFYLGHCYVSNGEYGRAVEKFVKAQRIGLPQNLEFPAHCSLGIAYYALKDYAQARVEFEKCA